MSAAAPSLMTTKELLALVEDGRDCWLIRGQLREKPKTFHTRVHSRTMVCVGSLLSNWLDQQPQPRGEVLIGEAGVILRRNPDTTIGVDVVYISAELVARESD